MANEFTERMRSLNVIIGGRPSRPKVREERDSDDGHRIKRTSYDGNIVSEHNTKDDRVDVLVRPETVTVQMSGEVHG